MYTPARKPTTPQKAVAIAAALTGPSMYSFTGTGTLASPILRSNHHERDGRGAHDQQGMDEIGRVPRVVGRDRGTDRDETEDQELHIIKH